MIRDPGPIQNLGHGVISRNVPVNEDETEGIAPNSGYVSRAFNNHPIMRFLATTATTMVAVTMANRVTKKGGLKLLSTFEKKYESNEIVSRAIHTAKQVRQHLDELQGVNRYVDSTDESYGRFISETKEGGYSTGYEGMVSERFGFRFLTREERKVAESGLLGESYATWSFRDEFQQKLVRAGRRLPYELPAFYAVQKGVTDPLFGDREQGTSKTKWYNPVDVVSDFVTESVKSIATMVIPFEAAGAFASTAKSSLHGLQYSMSDIRNLSPVNQKMHKAFVNAGEVLSQVGHDFASVTNKILKKAGQSTGAFDAAALEYKTQQQGIVQTLKRLNRGVVAAREKEKLKKSSEQKIRSAEFFALFKSPTGGEYSTVFDLIPAFRGVRAAAQVGKKEYKLLGQANRAMENALAFNEVLSQNRGLTRDTLNDAIKRIQTQHRSRLSELAHTVRIMGPGGPGDSGMGRDSFGAEIKRHAFKGLIERQLVNQGINKKDALNLVRNLDVDIPNVNNSITKLVTIGKKQILTEGTDGQTGQDLFFSEILKRYQGISGSKELVENLKPNQFKKAVEDAVGIFDSRAYQIRLDKTIKSNWNKFYRDDLHNIAASVLKPKKALYQEFIGDTSQVKLEFLQRKTAQTLGIKLIDSEGRKVSDDIVKGELKKRGFNPSNFTDLRAFLIKNRQMTSGVFRGGYNLFGLQQLTIDEAQDRGLFRAATKQDQEIIRDIAGKTAIKDPVSASIGLSRLDGVYKTKSGEILDFTSIKSSFSKTANFFASQFKIPILGFNPADLFGYNSYADIARRSPIQFISTKSVQPFVNEVDSNLDFFLWHKTGGMKGKLIGYGHDPITGNITSQQMQGTYRALPTSSADLLTRHARYATGEEGLTPEQIRGQARSGFVSRLLDKTFGEGTTLNIKKRLAIDTEQPNSLLQKIGRFRNRREDLDNPAVMARLIRGEAVSTRTGQLRLDVIDDQLRIVDDAGAIVDAYSEADVLRGVGALRKEAFQYGMPKKVMEALEQRHPELFKALDDIGVSGMIGESQLVNLARQLETAESTVMSKLKERGIDPTPVLASFSRIRYLLDQSNLNSASMMTQKSPTISTRIDELRNEIFRYVSQKNQILNNRSNDEIFIKIQEAIEDLYKQGVINSAQRTEAQAAGLATMFNISAFRTFKGIDTDMESARLAAIDMFRTSTSAGTGGLISGNPNVTKLFNPFAEGDIAQVTSSIRKKFSPLLSTIRKRYGTAGYSPDELAIDPLGSGQAVTLVPTFGNVFGKDPMAAIKSAIGFTTYSDPKAFSGASVPVSQGVERLNRYFGSLGQQLDVSNFKGPLDLFARGMVGSRVLPLYAAGTTAMTIDRTLGGMVNPKDENDQRVYGPLILGEFAKVGVEAQAAMAGLVPGGATYEEKREQLVEGEVPIRQGRYWPLGNTPFVGGKIMYYRPSWYQKLQAGALFTSDTYGSPAEKFLFYNDISPLRPLDPYRFEREHYYDRPYPVTGEYFTGPFGPLTPLGNLTIGKLLKPQKTMHEEELSAGLASYAPAGEFGAYDAAAYTQPIMSLSGQTIGTTAAQGAFGYGGSGASFGFGIGGSGMVGGAMQANYNRELASRAGSRNIAAGMVTESLGNVNADYIGMSYGPPKVSKVMPPRIIASGTPIRSGGYEFQGSEFAYRAQEMLGIYGFAGGALREGLGFGQSELQPQRSVLQSSSKAYSSTRAFWDLNLGGLGDVPLPSAEGIGNIEFSEIVRRFIPKERTGVDYINPIQNLMGQQYPFLPGPEYFTNFKTGDPFTKVQEGEVRLPGIGYERFNRLNPDEYGRYGLIDQLNILGDVAPYSQQFKSINKRINQMNLTPEQRIKVSEIRQQAESTTTRYDFQEYDYKEDTSGDVVRHPYVSAISRVGEMIAHSDNFISQKAFGHKTALEDWERRNVYGTTFPKWENPYEGYIQPMINKATQRNPIVAAAALGATGSFFGRTPRARLFGTAVGSLTGFTSSMLASGKEFLTGERFIPEERKKELALEEYSDILSYVKNTRLANMARTSGDVKAATQYTQAAKRTMYGADIYGSNIETLSLAIPKRKREHFKAMINAPVEERERILSTAGRLERRIYEGAWGMNVEKLPDLNEYFTRHELPDEGWEGWHPNTNIDHIKIKTGQSMGLDMSQMGYYPQQLREANLSNPSYPSFFANNKESDIRFRLQRLMDGAGVSGSVVPVTTPFGNNQIDLSIGVR